MEIEITKYNGKGKPKDTKSYPILNYKAISHPESLLLVTEGTLSDENDGESPFLEIKKVQFIAACVTAFSEHPLLAAFCIDEYSGLSPYLISGLSGDYHSAGDSFRLIDYRSYTEICEYTGENKLSLADYIAEIRTGSLGTNTLLSNDQNNLINYDQQKAYFEELDKEKKSKKQ